MVHFMPDIAVSHGYDEHAFQEWADREGHKHGAFLDIVTLKTAVTTWCADELILAARKAGFFRIINPMAVPV